MYDKAIVSVFSVVLILSVSLLSFGMLLLIIEKVSFDSACRNALFKIDIDGGLQEDTRNELIQDLESCGFTNIEVDAPEEIEYGQLIDFHVTAQHELNDDAFISSILENSSFTYESSVISRRIHNNAF